VVALDSVEEASVAEACTIGLDLAKHVFQAHGADASGRVVFRKRLRREQVLEFFAGKPACVVAMEACGSAHHWGRALGELGHVVRLIPPAYVRPFVKRQKNDAADAEAICEAAQRPTMRFVAVKGEAAQADAVVFRARDLLVRQRTQAINALRGHLGEYGLVAAKGPGHVTKLVAHVEDADSGVPEAARPVLRMLVEVVEFLSTRIDLLDREIARRAREHDGVRRLTSIPGVGPITATALAALAPPADAFRKGRDFAAWAGLTPLQHSTGGKQKLGATSKMGERTLRRLLIVGASSVVRKALREGPAAGSWLERMLARKPRMLVIVALANKMARTAWALMAKGETYRTPAVAA
jgi:transposase